MEQERISALIKEARALEEDKDIPTFLPFLQLIASIVGTAILILLAGTYNTFQSVNYTQPVQSAVDSTITPIATIPFFFLIYLIPLYFYYRLIKGRNTHFERTTKLYNILTEVMELRGTGERINIIKSRLNELRVTNNNKKSVGLNLVLAAILPFYFLYIYHFMNKDMVAHSKSEKLLLGEIIDVIKSRDPYFTKSLLDHKEVEDRSTFIYIILTILTLGIFGIYWAYIITRDYNQHIKSDRLLKDEIIASLSR